MGFELGDLFIAPDGLPDDAYGAVQLTFLLAAYGYILFFASNMISDGSELLLLIPSIAGIVGSCVLPVLGAVPDGAIVLFSGMGADAQKQLSVGVGALAGSTIMLITLPWALSVYAGMVTVENGECQYTKEGRLGKGPVTGVKNSEAVQKGGTLMILTSLTYLLIQGPAFFMKGSTVEVSLGEHWWALVGLIICTALFVGYIYYQYDLSLQDGDEVGEKVAIEKMINEIKQGKITLAAVVSPILANENHSWTPASYTIDEATQLWNHLAPQTKRKLLLLMKPFFQKFDADGSGYLDSYELAKVFITLNENIAQNDLDQRFKVFDGDGDGQLDFKEFVIGTTKYIYDKDNGIVSKDIEMPAYVAAAAEEKAPLVVNPNPPGYTEVGSPETKKPSEEMLEKLLTTDAEGKVTVNIDPPPSSINAREEPLTQQELNGTDNGTFGGAPEASISDALVATAEGEESDEEEEMPEDLLDLPPEVQRARLLQRSATTLTIGTLLVVLFSDPMTDVLGEVGERTGVPAFYVSFVLAPMASNASELIASYSYAAKKTSSSISISLQALQGAACMNNTFCLAIFMALIFFKGLAWQYTAETISILLAQVAIALVSRKQTQKMGDVFVVLSIYPLCLIAVYVMENVIGWD